MTAPLSGLIIDGTPVDVMQNAVDLNKASITGSTHTARADRFWSSRAAFIGNDVNEVLEIDYASASITNIISFDAVRFPHTIAVEYSTSTSNAWEPVLDSVTRKPVIVNVIGSYPPVLNDPSTIIGHFHPQHDYEGHWTRYSMSILPCNIQKLRFILQRGTTNGPVDVGGNGIPYSVALQNIDTGYKIASETDIPFHLDEDGSDTSGQVFANSADLFGSNLGFSKKTHKASNLLLNTEDDAPLIWKSEPQPVPNAVVNFYADLRDQQGKAQIIDQIFLDPLYLGCSVNLYYSNDTANGDFLSSRKGLSSNQAVFNGASITKSGPLSLGTWHSIDDLGNPAHFDPYYVQFDNFSLGFDPSLDWWVGFEWTRDWAPNTDANNHDIFACDAFRVGQSQTSFYLSTVNGDSLTLDNFTVDNEPIQVVAGYRAGLLHLTIQQGTETVENLDDQGDVISVSEIPYVRTVEIPASVPFSSVIPGQLLLGATTDFSVFSGGQITSFILSQSFLANDDFITNPAAYSLVPIMPGEEAASKYDALIRFDTTQLSLTNSTGFIGGPAHPYDSMTWTPIPRTYEMQRGYMKVPATKAKFWNLEITNLRPANVEKFVPVSRTVKFFPPELFNTTTSQTAATTRQTPDDLALNVLQDIAAISQFNDIPQYNGTGDSLTGITDTEVLVAQDISTANHLASTGSAWTFQQFHPDYTAPRFASVCVHTYATEQVTQADNVSYFAGLRNISFARTVKSAPQNLPIIEESFLDGDGVGTGNWIVNDNGIYSGVGGGVTHAVSTSTVMPTQTGLRGLQFAAQQSDAQVVDIDGNFAADDYDPNGVSTWTNYGDGKVLGLTYNQSTAQSALVVSREANHGYWGDIHLNWGVTYGDLEAIPVTYGMLSQGVRLLGGVDGGVVSQTISAPYGGRIHAAVRATASESLNAPLYVQILDSDTGQVLAESESNVSKNETKKWFASVDLADFNAVVGQTWGSLVNHVTWPSFSDTFVRANSTALGKMDSGQALSTPTGFNPLTIASNLAQGGTNTRSEINTGTPWGTMTIRFSGTVPTTSTHSAAIPMIDIGGIYLLNDGTFQNQNEVPSWGTLGETLTSAHDYNFKFMLTSEVASGQVPSGVDATLQPYSVVITTGTLGSDTWLKTVSSSRAFTSLRALMGNASTSFTKFIWAPGKEQVRLDHFIPGQFAVTSTDLTGITDNTYSVTRGNNSFSYSGEYTYDTSEFAVRASSLRPSGTILATPTGLTATPSSPGGNFTAGTYYYKITATNSFGETVASTESSAVVGLGGLVTLSWTAVSGAVNYNIYRGTATGGEQMVGSSGGATSFADLGYEVDATIVPPKYNSTNGAGTMMITDVVDQYGSFRFNVAQMPSNMTAADVILAYLDCNFGNRVVTLRGDGTIYEEIGKTSLGTIASFNPTAGPISVHYVNTALVSTTFKTAHPIANPTAILFFQAGTYIGMYTAATTWGTTIRGIGGANNGTGSTQYTIIEGFNWNPDGSSLAINTSGTTFGNVDYSSTRTYGQMSMAQTGSTQNLSLRILQKGSSNDVWFVESATFFWDPVVWEFSCDSGKTWWEASDVRNDPNGVLMFPVGLTAYNGLQWRLTSYAGRMAISHLAIRPWYVAQHGYVQPQPSHLPQGPNLIPNDYYAPIDRDPRWMAWDKPIPHWWWDESLVK